MSMKRKRNASSAARKTKNSGQETRERVLPFYSSSRNTCDFNHEIRAKSEIWLHREYNLAMRNKSLSYTMLHWSIVTHA